MSIKVYKQNLGILNNRYGEVERRLFEVLAQTGERVFVLGPAGDLLVANAVKDGFFVDKNVKGLEFDVKSSTGYHKSFPLTFTFWVTDVGVEFIRRFSKGLDIS